MWRAKTISDREDFDLAPSRNPPGIVWRSVGIQDRRSEAATISLVDK